MAFEDLDIELSQYVEEDHLLGHVLRHPLVYHVPFFEEASRFANQQLEAKRDLLNEKLNRQDISGAVFLFERPYRIDAFVEYEGELNDKEYWELLSTLWIDSENIPQNWSVWLDLITSDRAERRFFMTDEDWDQFDALPQKISVFQGINESLENDHKVNSSEEISWSTSREVAEFFAKRFGGKGIVIEKVINKEEVFAYLTARGEQEILIIEGELSAKVVR